MKKHLKKILALTLILSLCTTTMLSGTLAKYVSSESATATVIAAQFNLSSDNLSETGTFTMTDADLYGTGVTLYPGNSGFVEIDYTFVSDVDATIESDFSASIIGTGDGTYTITASEDTLSATGLRFYIVDSSGITGTDTDYAVQLSDFSSATLGTAYTYSTLLANVDATSYNPLETALNATYDASADDDNTVATTVYLYWVWEFEATNLTSATTDPAGYLVSNVITAATGDGTSITADTGDTADSSYVYYTYENSVYANISSIYDILDTAWGNAVYADMTSTDNTTSNSGSVITGLDIEFTVSVTATQSATAVSTD